MIDPIDIILKNEGGFSNDPDDAGGRTAYGISEKYHPEAWADGVVYESEARAIYEQKYVKYPGFDKITNPALQVQLIDFGVNSGPAVAIKKLQEVAGVDVDGVLGPETLAAVGNLAARDVNNQLLVSRVKMIGKIVVKNPTQLKFLNGWLNRALEFIV